MRKEIIKRTRPNKNLGELKLIERLITDVYPHGIVSLVSDTFNLWEVLTNYLPRLKDKIIARDGKLVIRPDSGDPVDILCGHNSRTDITPNLKFSDLNDKGITIPGKRRLGYNEIDENEWKGVIELLWDVFGGTINDKGYKVLDPHIGAIYGDSITLERCQQICERLEAKGFCSTNVVFGIGSFTYQYNTRDTFGFAMKATWCQVNGVGYDIFKDPVTDDGTKKSAKGLIRVEKDVKTEEFMCIDECTIDGEKYGYLQTVFENGKLVKETTLKEIRERLK